MYFLVCLSQPAALEDLDVLRNVVREKAIIPRVAPRVHLQLSDEGGHLRALAPAESSAGCED